MGGILVVLVFNSYWIVHLCWYWTYTIVLTIKVCKTWPILVTFCLEKSGIYMATWSLDDLVLNLWKVNCRLSRTLHLDIANKSRKYTKVHYTLNLQLESQDMGPVKYNFSYQSPLYTLNIVVCAQFRLWWVLRYWCRRPEPPHLQHNLSSIAIELHATWSARDLLAHALWGKYKEGGKCIYITRLRYHGESNH